MVDENEALKIEQKRIIELARGKSKSIKIVERAVKDTMTEYPVMAHIGS